MKLGAAAFSDATLGNPTANSGESCQYVFGVTSPPTQHELRQWHFANVPSRDAARGPERNEHLHQADPDLRVG